MHDMTASKERIGLIIAGSDPSGGAGIQADLKTFNTIGVYAGAVITCLTVQNTARVNRFKPVAAELVRAQIIAVLEDLPVSHIKIGMVGSVAVAKAIRRSLTGFAGEIILDPVMVASSGHQLVIGRDFPEILEQLLPLVTVLTPNIPELEKISQLRCQTQAGTAVAADSLFGSMATRLRAVIVTGGHGGDSGTVTDMLASRDIATGEPTQLTVSHPLIVTDSSHGTGCTFASAFTAYHLLHGADPVAFRKAVTFVAALLEKSRDHKIGTGNGPLFHHLVKG